MKQYLNLLQKIKDEGVWKENRTGIRTLSITGAMFEHDMATGFPLLTTKKMGLKTIATELEFFIQGMSDKKWLQDRKCNIWNEWSTNHTRNEASIKAYKNYMQSGLETGRFNKTQIDSMVKEYTDKKIKSQREEKT